MPPDLSVIKSITDLSTYIKEKPARAIYEFIVLVAAIFLAASLLRGQGWDTKALVLPVFVVMVIMVLVLVAQDRQTDKPLHFSFATSMIYFGVGVSFILMSLVLVAAVADAVTGERLSAWIPQKTARMTGDLSDRFFGKYNFLEDVRKEIQLQDDKRARVLRGSPANMRWFFTSFRPNFRLVSGVLLA